ncbi:MAG: hypothetical protein ACRENT_03945 [Thermodesulfobacteriota bacterium]
MKGLLQCLVFVVLLLPIIILPNQAQETEQKTNYPPKMKFLPPSGPSEFIFLKGSVKYGSAAELEKFFRQEMLPIIANSKEVRSMKVFSSKDAKNPTYYVILELKPGVTVSSSSAAKILSTGKTSQEASALLSRFSRYFDSVSISTEAVSLRSDLSISPGIAGTVMESKKQ